MQLGIELNWDAHGRQGPRGRREGAGYNCQREGGSKPSHMSQARGPLEASERWAWRLDIPVTVDGTMLATQRVTPLLDLTARSQLVSRCCSPHGTLDNSPYLRRVIVSNLLSTMESNYFFATASIRISLYRATNRSLPDYQEGVCDRKQPCEKASRKNSRERIWKPYHKCVRTGERSLVYLLRTSVTHPGLYDTWLPISIGGSRSVLSSQLLLRSVGTPTIT